MPIGRSEERLPHSTGSAEPVQQDEEIGPVSALFCE
jgi:hypothetical protein